MSFYENLPLVHWVANPGVFLPLWCYLALLGILFFARLQPGVFLNLKF